VDFDQPVERTEREGLDNSDEPISQTHLRPRVQTQVARQLKSGEKRLAHVCREHSLCQTLVRRWREQYEQKGENAWLEQAHSRHVAPDDKARIAALEAALGRAHLELPFLRHCLRELEQKGLQCQPETEDDPGHSHDVR
jgi:transposase-like protein